MYSLWGILGNSSKKRRKSPETSRRDWALCLCISLIHPITRLSRKNKPGHLDIDIDAVEQADKLGILDQEKPDIQMNLSLMTYFRNLISHLMLDWICSQIGSWIRRWTEFDAKMFPISKNPKIFVFVAISSVTWMDSHLGIETTGRLVEICEIGEITGKSSEIRARGSPRWAAVHFILRCIEPSRVQRVEKVTRNQGGAGNIFSEREHFSNSFRSMFTWFRWKEKQFKIHKSMLFHKAMHVWMF